MALTDSKIRNSRPVDKPFKLTDANGLYLEIRPTGSRLWRYRYRIDGRENVYAAGEYVQAPVGETESEAQARRSSGRLTLAEARVERETWRGLVKQRIHPAHHRKLKRLATNSENANTFEVVAREWVCKKSSDWTGGYKGQIESFLSTDVFPYIGTMPIRNVTAAHLLEILKRVEGRGAETFALMGRQWLSAVFRYSVATLRTDNDPAAALKGALHRPRVRHHKPLSRDQISTLVKALNAYTGYRTTVIALHLMLLTFVRTVELRSAKWQEFEFDRAEWRIPAERMKKRELHIVPLSSQSMALLSELKTLTGNREHLFPNNRNPKTCMTATTLNRALERMGFNGRNSIGFSAHGFRATASTILNELGFRPDVIERQLAHSERNTTRASYNQAEYLEERRLMMQQWADMVYEIAEEKVIPINHVKVKA